MIESKKGYVYKRKQSFFVYDNIAWFECIKNVQIILMCSFKVFMIDEKDFIRYYKRIYDTYLGHVFGCWDKRQ